MPPGPSACGLHFAGRLVSSLAEFPFVQHCRNYYEWPAPELLRCCSGSCGQEAEEGDRLLGTQDVRSFEACRHPGKVSGLGAHMAVAGSWGCCKPDHLGGPGGGHVVRAFGIAGPAAPPAGPELRSYHLACRVSGDLAVGNGPGRVEASCIRPVGVETGSEYRMWVGLAEAAEEFGLDQGLAGLGPGRLRDRREEGASSGRSSAVVGAHRLPRNQDASLLPLASLASVGCRSM